MLETIRGKKDEIQAEDFVIPVYLDKRALYGILGSLTGGFSQVDRKVITSSSKETSSSSKGGEFGVSPGFIKVGVEAKSGKLKEIGVETQHSLTQYQTSDTLFHILQTELNERGWINKVSITENASRWYVNVAELKKLTPGMFVELRGILRPSSVVQDLSAVVEGWGLLPKGGETAAPQRFRVTNQGMLETVKPNGSQNGEELQDVLTEPQAAESRTFVVDFSVYTHAQPKYNESEYFDPPYRGAIMTLLTRNARDSSLAELSNRAYRILGKVIDNAITPVEKFRKPLVRDTRFDQCVNILLAQKVRLSQCQIESCSVNPDCSDISKVLGDIDRVRQLLYDSSYYDGLVQGLVFKPPLLEILPIAIYS